ncbi:MAG: cache domain-containing protein, partial [Clostridia bacterium]|nr:cache domain-containing protein [Clostridia bacterium]
MVGEKQNAPLRRTGWRFAFVFCAVGIIINLAGAKLASLLALPLYLDSIGTILSAGLGGYIPGIAVGFVTNLLNSVSDPSTAYYGALNVLIAICAASFARKKWYSQFGKLPVMALVFALIGGTLGSVLTWMLAGFSMGSGITAPLALTLAQGGLPPFPAQCVADTAIDFLDKLICTLAAMLVMRFILKRFPGELWFHDWKQDSVPEKVRKARGDRFSRKMPIGRKILLLIAAAMVVIAIVVTGISFAQFHSANIESQTRLAYGVANVVSDSFDHDRVDEYIRLGENAEGYAESERRMASLMASSDDIEYVYVYQILPDGCHVVFDPDTSEETGANAGDIIPFDAAFDPYLPALLAGEAVEPIISNETYGWLLTVYVPVIDSAGECACYAAVDISMQRLMVNEYVFLTRTLSLFLGFFLLILAIGVYLARYNIVLPINAMAVTANAFAYNSEEARADSVSRIKALNIRTGDEIEN